MSHKRSSSPRFRRERSFSSLSSGSVDGPAQKRSTFDRDRRDVNRDRDGTKRRRSKTRFSDYDRSKGKEYNRESKKYSKDEMFLPDEESYLKPTKETTRQDDIEFMLDPSTCNFRVNAHHTEDNNTPTYEESTKKVDIQKNKDESGGRLERLEKLVEMLVTTNSKSQPIQVNSSQISQSSVNFSELIPRNTSFTTSMWLNKIQEECNERNFDENTTIQYLQGKMSGIIKSWYKTIAAYNFSWHDLKMLITETFPDNYDFAVTLKMLVERNKKPDESMMQYYFAKMYLLEACKISGENAVSCLIDGLETLELKQNAKLYNFLTPEALYSQFLLKIADYHIPQEYEYTTNQHVVEEQIVEPHITTYYDQQQQADIKSRKKCYTCKKAGHIAADCRHAPVCYKCKSKGHIAAKCHMNKVYLISSKKGLIGKYNFVSCSINGVEMQAYVDTGSSFITMRESVAQDLKLKMNPCDQVIQGYGGGCVTPLAEVQITIKVDLVECVLPAVVVPDDVQTVPIIIGQPLLHKEDVVMVLQNEGIRLFQQKSQ